MGYRYCPSPTANVVYQQYTAFCPQPASRSELNISATRHIVGVQGPNPAADLEVT